MCVFAACWIAIVVRLMSHGSLWPQRLWICVLYSSFRLLLHGIRAVDRGELYPLSSVARCCRRRVVVCLETFLV